MPPTFWKKASACARSASTHESLDTTVIYTHLTAISEARTHVALQVLYRNLKGQA
jgi:hypothetical protein